MSRPIARPTSCVSWPHRVTAITVPDGAVKPRQGAHEIKAVAVSTKKEEAVAAPAPRRARAGSDPTLAAKAPDKAPDAPASVAEPAAK